MLHCYTNTNTLHMTFLRYGFVASDDEIQHEVSYAGSSSMPLAATNEIRVVTFHSFLFLCEDANCVVLPTCEHHNTRSACTMLQRCC